VEALGGGDTLRNWHRRCCTVAIVVGGQVGEVIGAHAGPEEASAGLSGVGVSRLSAVHAADMAAAFHGAAAAQGIEASRAAEQSHW
jgi:hypothetical protein